MWRREGDDRCGGEKVMIDVAEERMWVMIDVDRREGDDRWGGEKVMIDVVERR